MAHRYALELRRERRAAEHELVREVRDVLTRIALAGEVEVAAAEVREAGEEGLEHRAQLPRLRIAFNEAQ